MPEKDANSLDEIFKRAVRAAADSNDQHALGTLLAAIAGDSALQRVAELELAPLAAELELHLEGEQESQHRTNAYSFGLLVTQIAESTKEFVKGRLHLDRFGRDLLISPGVGSVRATFAAPSPVEDRRSALSDLHRDGALWQDSNIQSEALRQIAAVLQSADPESPESDALDGVLEQFPAAARKHLATAIKEVVKRDWAITGEFRQRGIGVERLVLNPASARYLSTRLALEQTEEEMWTTTGVLDGHRWSTGLMYFTPTGGARSFPASYASTEIQQTVAVLAAAPEQQVEATFRVVITHGQGSGEQARRSYVLERIRPLDAGPGVELNIDDFS